jgi:hypothetical protein
MELVSCPFQNQPLTKTHRAPPPSGPKDHQFQYFTRSGRRASGFVQVGKYFSKPPFRTTPATGSGGVPPRPRRRGDNDRHRLSLYACLPITIETRQRGPVWAEWRRLGRRAPAEAGTDSSLNARKVRFSPTCTVEDAVAVTRKEPDQSPPPRQSRASRSLSAQAAPAADGANT